ncbi:MAG: 3-phosphoshikimate 1-carboxyvinyltransferase [Nitrospirae bacterium RBG_13_39_12]|nr:MAG: 3-phosphoshikimate 1-carboxyvinyltransferase [Nitrospirae bacterium RBG_13_39_12]
MDRIELSKAKTFKGTFSPPSDKSISHRAVIFSSISKGKSIIRNFLRAEDPLSTINVLRALGVDIDDSGENIIVNGNGIYGLKEPFNIIDCGNSGTTIRMLSGVLSGNPFFSVLTGDESLRTRPMGRVIDPLRQMGAEIIARFENRYPPIAINGKKLKPIQHASPVASAQVKSTILLAGLYADGETEIIEPAKSRDHTERMLPFFGAEIKVEGLRVKIKGGTELKSTDIYVPGDFSSAAFFIIAALLIKDSDLTIEGVGINPTRTGLISALKEMGSDIELYNVRNLSGEPVADIHCKGGADMKAINITKEKIPALIDEFPIFCVAATQAEGNTTIKGAEELRLKESDRIMSMTTELRKMGAEIIEFDDGLSIKGKTRLKGAFLESYRDHRIAMSLSIAALIADGTTTINGISSAKISFPGFFETLRRLTK